MDNLSAHKSEPVRKWLANPKRRRWHLHYTPTSASWLNLLEGWFSILTRKALKHNSFTSVAELTETIDNWTAHWNHNPRPLHLDQTPQPHHRPNPPRTHHTQPRNQIRDGPLAIRDFILSPKRSEPTVLDSRSKNPEFVAKSLTREQYLMQTLPRSCAEARDETHS